MAVSQVEEYLQKLIIDEIFCNNIIFENKPRINTTNDEKHLTDKTLVEKEIQEPYIDYSDLLNDDEIKNTHITTDSENTLADLKEENTIIEALNNELFIKEGNIITEPFDNEIENNDSLNEESTKKEPDCILLIVSLGRTGSTALCNVLNLIPNTNICGENNNAIFKLLQSYQKLKEIKTNIPTSSNYNTYSLKEMRTSIKNMIVKMLKNKETTTLWGFREIRWAEDFEMLNIFTELFTETKIIINVRDDIIKQSKSAYWADIPTALQDLKEQSKALHAYYYKNIQRCFKISLEEFYDMNIMKALYSFIQKEQNFNEEINTEAMPSTNLKPCHRFNCKNF